MFKLDQVVGPTLPLIGLGWDKYKLVWDEFEFFFLNSRWVQGGFGYKVFPKKKSFKNIFM